MVGHKIRQKRKQEQLTIAKLAAMTGVSESYISQLEREIIDPSVSVLRKIASALQVPVSSFFDEEFEAPILVQAQNRKESYQNGVYLSWISPIGEKIEMIEFVLDKNTSYTFETFDKDICILVSEGTIQIEMEPNQTILYEQDSIFISKHVPFTLCNDTNTKVSGIISASKGSVQE